MKGMHWTTGVSFRRLAERHTLMVACTATENLGDHFVKHPRQTSMYYHYGLWCGHDSAPRWGPNSGLVDAQEFFC